MLRVEGRRKERKSGRTRETLNERKSGRKEEMKREREEGRKNERKEGEGKSGMKKNKSKLN